MITGGRTQARDDVFALVKTVLETQNIEAIWQDDLEEHDVDVPAVSVSMYHFNGSQTSIGNATGSTRWRQEGNVEVRIRFPVKNGGLTKADDLTTMLENVFRSKSTPNGVWFRDVTGREVPPKDGNVRVEITAQFTYQEVVNV